MQIQTKRKPHSTFFCQVNQFFCRCDAGTVEIEGMKSMKIVGNLSTY